MLSPSLASYPIRFLKRCGKSDIYFQELSKTLQYKLHEIEAYQSRKLQRMIQHCYANVPYYTDLFRHLKLKPEDIQDKTDLKKLPFLDKATVQEHFDRLKARNCQQLLCRTVKTSGSTGSPGRFVRDLNIIQFEDAVIRRYYKQCGIWGKRRVTLKGDVFIPTHREKPPFWREHPAFSELLMSVYHLSPQNSHHYVYKILDFQPKVLFTYPSTAMLMASFFQRHQVPSPFEAILTTSETLTLKTRDNIEAAFHCPVYDWYGQTERVASIQQCPSGFYMILEDYSIVELLESSDTMAELVGTQLENFAMPLLRYRTGDHVIPAVADCPCGISFRHIQRVVGRNPGFVITPEGFCTGIHQNVPKHVPYIVETQFIQDKPGELLVKIVTEAAFTMTHQGQLHQEILAHTSPRMKVTIQQVPEIQRGPNGKFVSIINRCNPTAAFQEECFSIPTAI